MKHATLLVLLLTASLVFAGCGERRADRADAPGPTSTTGSGSDPVIDDVRVETDDEQTTPVEPAASESTSSTAPASTTAPTTTTAGPTPGNAAPTTSAAPTTTEPAIDQAALTAAADAIAAAEALLSGLESDSAAIAGDLAADAQASATTD